MIWSFKAGKLVIAEKMEKGTEVTKQELEPESPTP